MNYILIGSTYPLTLIRRKVVIEPQTLDDLLAAARGRELVSFWGHTNTMKAAEALVGFSVAPKTERPALILTEDGFPSLDGVAFAECWVVSPEYRTGFRPAIGAEVEAGDITGWQILHMTWE